MHAKTPAVVETRTTWPVASAAVSRWIPAAFCASGFAALLYQVVWQRVLFAVFGVNVEATTVVVTAFLAGLGCGSLLGGWLADASDAGLLRRFGALEFAIGAFGAVSLSFFRAVGEATITLSPPARGAVMALVVMLPTTLMGATLPLLVAYVVRGIGNVGRAVSTLYFVNTAGSAIAAFMAVLVLLRSLGEHRSVMVAVAVNLSVAGFVLIRAFTRYPR